MTKVLLSAKNLSHHYGSQVGCIDVNFNVYPGEVLGVVEVWLWKNNPFKKYIGSPPTLLRIGQIQYSCRWIKRHLFVE